MVSGKGSVPPIEALPVGKVVTRLLERCGLREKRRLFELVIAWEDIVGSRLAAHSQPLRLRGGVLEVRVDQAVWMQHLHLQKKKILDAVAGYLGESLIRDIFWRFGALEAVEDPAAPEYAAPDFSSPPSEELESETEALLQSLPDSELRDRFRRLILDARARDHSSK